MNFLPLLMMMNGMNREKRQNNSLDTMIQDLNRVKAFEDIQNKSSAEQMESIAGMMAGDNPQMKGMMDMMRMMNVMNAAGGSNGPNADGKPPGETRTQSFTEESEPPSDDSRPDREPRAPEGTPLRPIAKIANRDITYLLNRYINR